MKDEDLVKMALQGDDNAFRKLHDRYIGQVFRYAYVQTGDYHRAEEIAQDVMYKMAVNLNQFKGKSSFKTWLFTIGRRVVIDYHRKYSKENQNVYVNQELLNQEQEPELVEQRIVRNSVFEELLNVMENMSPDDRTVLHLRFFEGLSLKETAKVMSKTVLAVKSLQTRAKKKLIAQLRREVSE